MAAPTSANQLPAQTPNSSAPIAVIDAFEPEGLYDSLGKPITGTLQSFFAKVTPAWRYLFGTFVQRAAGVDSAFTQSAGTTYSQTSQQALIDQVAALSKAVGVQQ